MLVTLYGMFQLFQKTNNYLLKQYAIVRFYKGQMTFHLKLHKFALYLLKKLKIIAQACDGEYSQGYL